MEMREKFKNAGRPLIQPKPVVIDHKQLKAISAFDKLFEPPEEILLPIPAVVRIYTSDANG